MEIRIAGDQGALGLTILARHSCGGDDFSFLPRNPSTLLRTASVKSVAVVIGLNWCSFVAMPLTIYY